MPDLPKKKKVVKVVKKAVKAVRKVGKEKKKLTVDLYSLDGKVMKSLELPDVFSTELRRDIISRAVLAFRTNRRQRYGPSPSSGMRRSVETWGKGRGVARIQRVVGEFRGAQSPGTVGGRRAHPPKMRAWYRKVNAKERQKAKLSALAATADANLVRARGHVLEHDANLPIVVEDKFEELEGTKDVIEVLRKLKLYGDVLRAQNGTHMRAGRGKMRSRRYRTPRSILVVLSEYTGVEKGLRNLPGVEVALPRELNAELLAPGGSPGRLTVYTQKAIETIRGWRE